ncbi:hypothetical protein CRP01_37535 [Flavilitoribacter nigricans DSM 23189 = NBRC 102662]|uniref:Uncharacterized protein n=2 Tax=Flavilitoribacter TaxID=2762562 RepID=A0A2D0MYM0_FLAN2|nr:hypothetical protein CRP01_37535 [Flavilitoribacter nigricans DSM 23189 = NBRC 102662]
MKYILIFVISLGFACAATGQSYQDKWIQDSLKVETIKAACSARQIRNLIDLGTQLQAFGVDDQSISIVRRNLQYGAEHQIWWVDFLQTKSQEYFSLILWNGQIIALELYESGLEDINFRHTDREKMLELRQLKEQDFGTIALSDDLLFPLEIKIFGHWCSIGGVPPTYALRMLDLVNEKNKAVLSNWLLSFDPEIQAYATEGLYYLEQEGIPRSRQELELIEKLNMISNTLIKCEGCFYYVKRKFREDLDKKSLKRSYKAYKESGWIYRE